MRRSCLWILFFVIVGICKGNSPKWYSPCTLTVDCPGPVTLTEGMKYDTSVTGAPKITSNNGGVVTISWLEVYQKGDCKNHADQVTRIFTITNAIGDQVRCNQTITLQHLTINQIYFPTDTTLDYPDSLTTLTHALVNIPKTLGSIDITYSDTRVSQNCNNPVRIRRIWSLADKCSSLIRYDTTFMNLHRYFNGFIQLDKQSDAICSDDGYINLTPVGEFGPYKYKWSSGDSLPNIFNKIPGSYTLTITDKFACTANIVYTLSSMSQRADIGGRITTDVGIRVIPDSLIFENESLISKYCISQNSGIHYGFTLKSRKIGQYNYHFVKNSEPTAGISTKDIVLIQRHILQISKFTDTLQYIAADVNYNYQITASDISELRRLILGVKANFSVVKPWYFFRKDWRTIAKPNKPISDLEFTGINVPNFPLTNTDIFVLKMGDIDLSYNGLKDSKLEQRSKSDEVTLELHPSIKIKNENWIPVYLKSAQSLEGIQFKLSNTSNHPLKILNSQLDESFVYVKNNSITVSWSTGPALDWNSDLPLFFINGMDANELKEDHDFSAEWYDASLNEFGLKINTVNPITQVNNNFFYPNPTTDKIHFNFDFENLEVTIYYPDGKLILSKTLHDNQELNIQYLISGIYILSCKRENGNSNSDLLLIE